MAARQRAAQWPNDKADYWISIANWRSWENWGHKAVAWINDVADEACDEVYVELWGLNANAQDLAAMAVATECGLPGPAIAARTMSEHAFRHCATIPTYTPASAVHKAYPRRKQSPNRYRAKGVDANGRWPDMPLHDRLAADLECCAFTPSQNAIREHSQNPDIAHVRTVSKDRIIATCRRHRHKRITQTFKNLT